MKTAEIITHKKLESLGFKKRFDDETCNLWDFVGYNEITKEGANRGQGFMCLANFIEKNGFWLDLQSRRTIKTVQDLSELFKGVTGLTLPALSQQPLSGEELQRLIFEAMGEVSMCWIPQPSSQVFDSTKAEQIGMRLYNQIAASLTPNKPEISAGAIDKLLSADEWLLTKKLKGVDPETQVFSLYDVSDILRDYVRSQEGGSNSGILINGQEKGEKMKSKINELQEQLDDMAATNLRLRNEIAKLKAQLSTPNKGLTAEEDWRNTTAVSNDFSLTTEQVEYIMKSSSQKMSASEFQEAWSKFLKENYTAPKEQKGTSHE